MDIEKVDKLITSAIKEKINIYTGVKAIEKDIEELKKLSFSMNQYNHFLQLGYVQFEEQLTAILEKNPPADDILAFNFGIYQSDFMFQLSISGSLEWSEEDEDWATNNDYFQNESFSKNSLYRKLYIYWRYNNDLGLFLTVVSTVMLINTYIDKHPNKFKTSTVFATGFDDGDLYIFRIKD